MYNKASVLDKYITQNYNNEKFPSSEHKKSGYSLINQTFVHSFFSYFIHSFLIFSNAKKKRRVNKHKCKKYLISVKNKKSSAIL